ncbi:RNA polymerase II-specific transcription factor-like protein [Microdochium nivale]|nr:RNA polymerase II-specific transcription factor-like protein [Microdochium nivale]
MAVSVSVSAFPRPPAAKRHVEMGEAQRGLVPSKAPNMSDPPRPSHLHVDTQAANTNGLGHLSSSLPLPHIDIDERNSPRANKARNKLGYHRSSVACGHCRRRKIRCKVDTKNSHGRCESCIKLKRECEFQPIDMPTESTMSKSSGIPLAKSKARAIASSKARSLSSSPAVPHEFPAKTETPQYPASYTATPCPTMGPPILRHHSSSTILPGCHEDSEDNSGLGHSMGHGGWVGESRHSPDHEARTSFQADPWRQLPCASPPIVYGHFPMQVAQQTTEWPHVYDDLGPGSGSVRPGGEWDPTLHSPSPRTLSHGSEDSAGPHYTILPGSDAQHRASFDRRSSMNSDMYVSTAHPSALASPVESTHAQEVMTQGMGQHGVPAPSFPWQQQQAYPYHAQRPIDGYGPAWYMNQHGPYQQQHQEVRRQSSHGQLPSQSIGHGHQISR